MTHVGLRRQGAKDQDRPTDHEKPRLTKADLQNVYLPNVCAKYRNKLISYYVGQAISPTVKKVFGIPDTQRILAYFETSYFSSRAGLAICSNGIYWRNRWAETEFMSWRDFASVNIVAARNSVRLGYGKELKSSGWRNSTDMDVVARLLEDLQLLIRRSDYIITH
ncbi:MAG: hypothetical protein ICV68_18070 [Pyrinomonadaceae bacterium]|nr:hypothetical protein [Pyrinomonadaceae bacterium]